MTFYAYVRLIKQAWHLRLVDVSDNYFSLSNLTYRYQGLKAVYTTKLEPSGVVW